MAENAENKTSREIRLAKRINEANIVPYVAPHIKRIIDLAVEKFGEESTE